MTNVSANSHPSGRHDDVEPLTRPLAAASGMLLVLAIAAGLTLHAHRGRIIGISQPTAGSTPPAADGGLRPSKGQVIVNGTVTALTATNAVSSPLKTPFTITVAARGQGGADITGIQVGGREVAVSWNAGEPLPLSGSGTLKLDGAPLVANSSGLTWTLDGAVRQLTPGHYFLNAPVAVGPAGLARHASTVSFQAGSVATIKTSGGAVVHELPSAVHLEGPGRITLHGHFTLRSPSRVQTVSTIVLGVAPKDARFSIDLTPEAGGYSIKDAVLQGPVEAT